MRLYKSNKFRVIFLVPIIMAAQNGGCSTTPDPGPLAKAQIVQAIAGNTVVSTDQKAFAYVDAKGTMAGLNTPNGGKTGTWRVNSEDLLCAKWNEGKDLSEICDLLSFQGNDEYNWGNRVFKISKGNIKNL